MMDPNRYKKSAMAAFWSGVGLILTFLYILLFG